MEGVLKKSKRSQNWSESEQEILISECIKRNSIINGKLSNSVSSMDSVFLSQ